MNHGQFDKMSRKFSSARQHSQEKTQSRDTDMRESSSKKSKLQRQIVRPALRSIFLGLFLLLVATSAFADSPIACPDEDECTAPITTDWVYYSGYAAGPITDCGLPRFSSYADAQA